jgi:hypothetical protein
MDTISVIESRGPFTGEEVADSLLRDWCEGEESMEDLPLLKLYNLDESVLQRLVDSAKKLGDFNEVAMGWYKNGCPNKWCLLYLVLETENSGSLSENFWPLIEPYESEDEWSD